VVRALSATEACLARIAERDPVVGAWAHLDRDAALEAARACDATPPRTALHGVPVGVKDIIDTAGLPTEYGSPVYAGHRPVADAACVRMLREAGAVVLGKTVTTEFATYQPPRTVNPLDPRRTPGGSSSGSAAAVADGMVPLALGSQTAGSTIRPASFCGILGFKPTHGAIDLGGVLQLSARLDTLGLFARTPDELALLAGALLPAARQPRGAAAPRIAFVRSTDWEEAEPSGQAAVEGAAERLASAGAAVEDVRLPAAFDGLPAAQETIMAVDACRSLAREREQHAHQLSEPLRDLLARGAATAARDYGAAVELAERCRGELGGAIEGFDAILTPAARGEAPVGHDSTGDPLFCRAWTLLGTPAVSVPGMTGESGMPVGAQLVGRWGADWALLGLAAWAFAALQAS
jgi:Asp-tRNA(Asn)/Glu-tRNA(Gln) amidotransferase A subunit family amidase